MLLGLLIGMATAADTGETGACERGTQPVSATYIDGVCVAEDVASVCGSSGCPAWADLVASYGSEYQSRWTLADCGAGSGMAHQATLNETEWYVQYDFDSDGSTIGVITGNYQGIGFCCGGQIGDAYAAGVYGASCLPDDSGTRAEALMIQPQRPASAAARTPGPGAAWRDSSDWRS